MSTEKQRSAEPQGAWVRDVVRDLAEDAGDNHQSATGSEIQPGPTAPPEDHQASEPDAPAERQDQPTEKAAEPHETDSPPRFDGKAISSRIRHGDKPARRVARWVSGNIRAGRDNTHLVERFDALRRPITTGRRVAVAGARGGAGTTTLALLMAAVLSAWRDDDVLALDADPEPGSLLWRTGLDPRLTAAEVAHEVRTGAIVGRDDLVKRVALTPGGLWALQGVAGETTAGEDRPDPYALARELGRFYAVTVLDCGGPLGTASADRIGSTAHAAVLVASATVDGVRAARDALERSGEDAPPTVVALVPRTPNHEGLDMARAERLLDRAGPHVVAVPYDRHLAAGAEVDVSRLAEATLVAVVDVAGRALALAAPRGGPGGTSDGDSPARADGRQR